MKRCLYCDARHDTALGTCPTCQRQPALVDGFTAYAPESARAGGGFEAGYFAQLARLEADSFWFRSRNMLILWALRRYRASFGALLEIGCGTGYVLAGIADAFADARLTGSEIFVDGLGFAMARAPAATLIQMDARRIPFDAEFDVIGAFDVLEHIGDDRAALQQIHAALRPGGAVLLSVPQHQWLWSPADDYARHERRYAIGELERKLRDSGFDIVRSTSFVSLLLPVLLISRLIGRRRGAGSFDAQRELALPRVLDRLFAVAMRAEFAMIRLGLDLPLGGSRLIVATRRPDGD